ncbi:zinc-binding dehydrogenase [Chitinimonas sp.]|uniref:zinc-binding dehydrogenase n=1 Tax=Chitinimonas sp. TaxID=1934313 RepID=UPI002F946F1C
MKAVVRKQYGGPEQLSVMEVPTPRAGPGTVLIQVRAFGLNRAELYMRRGDWGDVAVISGIECVGTVVEDGSGRLCSGQTVVAMMGGMGRSFAGSYAEYTAVPASNVLPIETSLDWDRLAALPEAYAVAWTCLHRNLAIEPGQRLVVRGGSASLGQAAIDIAAQLGAEVIATTRRPDRADSLRQLGAHQVLPAIGELAGAEGWPGKADAVLDLIGNTTLLDSMRATRRGGRVCLAGFLGGLAPLADFDPLSQMPSGVQLSFFGSFMFGQPGFELADVPMQQIVDLATTGQYQGRPARVFGLSDLPEAHRLMEANEAGGKLVVVV